jgi:hypothetical protein
MKKILLYALSASALFTSAAAAAPLSPLMISDQANTNVEHVRLVCNEYGRCYRTRGPRYVYRRYGDDDGYVVRRSYGYGGGPGYYGDRPGYGYYGGGPSIGFSFGSRSW